MVHDAHSNSPHADPLGESSPNDQKAENVAGGVSNFRVLFARYVRYYEELRAEGVGVEEAMKRVRDKLER